MVILVVESHDWYQGHEDEIRVTKRDWNDVSLSLQSNKINTGPYSWWHTNRTDKTIFVQIVTFNWVGQFILYKNGFVKDLHRNSFSSCFINKVQCVKSHRENILPSLQGHSITVILKAIYCITSGCKCYRLCKTWPVAVVLCPIIDQIVDFITNY